MKNREGIKLRPISKAKWPGSLAKIVVVGAAWGVMLHPCFSAARSYSDAELIAAQIGTWMVPKDSSDLTEANQYSREIFRTDGTVTTYFYSQPDCKGLLQQVEQHWTIKGGIETSVVDATGYTMKDRILDFTKDRLTILSLDDGTIYTRERTAPCGASTS